MKDKLSANGNGDTSNGFNGFSSENGIAPKASTSKLALDDTLALSPQLSVSRTEFVKLALQTLRSAGYTCVAYTAAARD